MSKYTEKELADAKALTAKLKKTPGKESFTKSIADFLSFVKKLTATLFSLSILGLGIVAVIYSQQINNDVYRLAVIVSGSCTIVDGFYLLYKALMSK